MSSVVRGRQRAIEQGLHHSTAQGCDERSGDVDTGHGTFEAVARRKEHCGLVYGAIRQFDPSEPHGVTPD